VRVLVLYESRRGFTLRTAEAIRDEIRAAGRLATCAAVGTVDAGTFAACHALVVGAWIQGMIVMKVRPADAAMAGIAALPDLEGRPAAVFCTFDVSPSDALDRMANALQARGARPIGVRGEFSRRRKLDGVPGFVQQLVPALEAALPEVAR
jgi:flavodoxin